MQKKLKLAKMVFQMLLRSSIRYFIIPIRKLVTHNKIDVDEFHFVLSWVLFCNFCDTNCQVKFPFREPRNDEHAANSRSGSKDEYSTAIKKLEAYFKGWGGGGWHSVNGDGVN